MNERAQFIEGMRKKLWIKRPF